jgi:RimJ/RimL family protein N-acetyltransferase
VIQTERLLLRPLERGDLEWYARFQVDPHVTRYLTPGGRTLDGDEAARLFERALRVYPTDGFGHLAVVRKDDRTPIGRCGLLVWEVDPWRPSSHAEATRATEVEIGWMLGRDYWGCGYATEAAVAVRADAFGRLGLSRLVSLIHPDNNASIRVAEKLGMARDRVVETRVGRVLVYATPAATDQSALSRRSSLE